MRTIKKLPLANPFRRAILALMAIAVPLASADTLDVVRPGDPASEAAHAAAATQSEIVQGVGPGDVGRRFLPDGQGGWRGGTFGFTARVDPSTPNYLTVRLSGSDATTSRLVLFCENKQVGYLHLGDVDVLHTPNGKPPLPGRFFYVTTPLPAAMTKGKTTLACELRSLGRVYGYASQFDQYQKPMTEPTAGVFGIYTHTTGFFAPPADEPQGPAPADLPRRTEPGPAVIEDLKTRVNSTVDGMLESNKPLDQLSIWFLSRAHGVRWTRAYRDPKALQKIVDGIDAYYAAFKADPTVAQSEKSMYNGDWFGLGPIGASVSMLGDALRPVLDAPAPGTPLKRRDAWSTMLVASRDHHRQTRRQYTNQSMISDTYGIYQCNRGVAALMPERAMPEAAARKYLYESAAIEPWLGSERNGVPEKPLGTNYFQLTAKGLTKELGFVGYYGEVLDWMTTMYDATRPAPGQPGDEKLKAQLVKAAKARAVFRYPAADVDGHRAMLAEAIVGWRDMDHYPADVIYGQRSTWDASSIESAAATLDPTLVGYAQQMLGDNQFFASVAEQMKTKSLRATAGLLNVPDDYERIKAAAPSAARLPMTADAGDVAFADEEDGVVAVRRGTDILYVSLYWRARYAVNGLARVHHITPRFDRIAVVRQETKFQPDGRQYTRPNWINFGFGNGGPKYPDAWDSALAGETQPIAKIPAGLKFRPGDENVHAGRSDFYTLRYGPYLIGMNCTADRTFALDVPAGVGDVPDLMSGRPAARGKPLSVPAKSTVVLLLEMP